MNATRCGHCPVSEGLACAGVSPGRRGYAVPRYCELAEKDPRYHRVIREESAHDAGWSDAPRDIANVARIDEHTFLTTDRLARDTMALLPKLPADIDCIVGISRSGLLPASILSYGLHVPLLAVSRQTGVTDPGHGYRIGDGGEPRHLLLIDDTICTGREMSACRAIVRDRFPDAVVSTAAVYAVPEAAAMVDHVRAIYPGGHYLEWNFANSCHAINACWDMDGLICRDFTAEECADEDLYARTLDAITPLHLPRREPIHTIVTARRERYRTQTMAWLDRHGVRVKHLVMRDFEVDPAGWTETIARYKAWHYRNSNTSLFLESEPAQAELIASYSGRRVLCPDAGRMVLPRTEVVAPTATKPAPSPGAVRVGLACPGFPVGGAERWAESLIAATDGDGLNWVGVACPDPMAPRDTIAGITGRCSARFGPDAVRELAREVDVLLVWGIRDWPGLIDAARSCRVILVSHGLGEDARSTVLHAASADLIVAVGRSAVEAYPPDQQARVRIIHNAPYARAAGVSRAETRSRWGVPDGVKVLGTLGRLVPEKNPAALPAAAAALPLSWIGVAVGPNPDGLSADRVIYPGSTDDPGSTLAAFDAMLMPSPAEGCGIVLIEAWLAGVPVISTPAGLAMEFPDLVRSIPVDADGATIAAALLADDGDPEGTTSRVDRARTFAEVELSAERFGGRWRTLLIEATQPTPPRTKWVDLRPLVLECDYRGPVVRPSCGCQGEWRLCGMGKGPFKPGEVTMGDCLQCVKTG